MKTAWSNCSHLFLKGASTPSHIFYQKKLRFLYHWMCRPLKGLHAQSYLQLQLSYKDGFFFSKPFNDFYNFYLKGLAMIFSGQENPWIIFRSKERFIYISKQVIKIPVKLKKLWRKGFLGASFILSSVFNFLKFSFIMCGVIERKEILFLKIDKNNM